MIIFGRNDTGIESLPLTLLIGAALCLLIYIAQKLRKKYVTLPKALRVFEVLKRQAIKRNGVMTKDVSEAKPEMSFYYDSTTISVSIAEGGRVGDTTRIPQVTYATVQTGFLPDKNLESPARNIRP